MVKRYIKGYINGKKTIIHNTNNMISKRQNVMTYIERKGNIKEGN